MADQSLGSHTADVEQTIACLRQNGCSVIDTIRQLIRHHRMSLADAKRSVHFSETWADMRVANDEFHRELEAAVKELAADKLER